MVSPISAEVYDRALKVAHNLRSGLEARLIGMTASFSGVGSAQVIAIHASPGSLDQIALWSLWTCHMMPEEGQSYSLGISNFISWEELLPMFRNAFAGIPVKVEHPGTVLRIKRWQASSEERKFTGSGRRVMVRIGEQAYVRPVGDLTKSPWLNAQLRLDANLERYPTKEPRICCNIDPFEFEQRSSRGEGMYGVLPDASDQLTFYVGIPPKAGGTYFYLPMSMVDDKKVLPIARVVDVNKASGEITFELDESVESMGAEGTKS